jgi:type I restriction enzyme S subunit
MSVPNTLPWIGEFKAGWKLVPNKALIKKKKVSVGLRAQDYDLLSLTKQGVIVRNLEEGGKFPENFDSYQRVEPGDLVTCLFDVEETPRTIGIAKSAGMITGAYDVFEFTDLVNPRFFEYYYLALDQRKGLKYFYTGLRNVIKTPTFLGIPMPIPPRAEQDAIVTYLDLELKQIDALISKSEELVTNLVDRRKALIARFVAFGSASSIAVPANWVPQRLRNLATIESGRDYKEVEVLEGGYPIYGSGGEFGRASRYLFSGESVLLGRKGTIDRPMYVNGAFWTVDTMYWTRFKPGVCIKFMYYWATTIPFKMYSTNTALPSMTGADLKNMRIDLPPLDEQISIAKYLDQALERMDILQTSTEKSVQLLKERRLALISSAVTGKLKLQGAN